MYVVPSAMQFPTYRKRGIVDAETKRLLKRPLHNFRLFPMAAKVQYAKAFDLFYASQ